MLTQADIQKKTAELSKKYGRMKCMEFANDLRDWLVEQKVKGKYLTMSTSNPRIDYISLDSEPNKVISENGKHYGIEVNGIVYDNFFQDGIRRGDWERSYKSPVTLKVAFSSF